MRLFSGTPTPSVANPAHRRRWVWAAAALAVVLIFLLPAPVRSAAPQARSIRIQAGGFAYSPAEIRVNQGDQVTIELESSDVVHGIYLDGYGLSVTAEPGKTGRLSFTADRPGAFRFRCSVTCGALHPFMTGKLHVGTNGLLWKALGAGALLALAGLWGVRP